MGSSANCIVTRVDGLVFVRVGAPGVFLNLKFDPDDARGLARDLTRAADAATLAEITNSAQPTSDAEG